VHWDRDSGGCTIHAQRPHICRQYDCRNDKRVWLDFEQRVAAPMPEALGQMPVAMVEVVKRDAKLEGEEPGGDPAGEPDEQTTAG
jgi:Fe-S-cluster containining protein